MNFGGYFRAYPNASAMRLTMTLKPIDWPAVAETFVAQARFCAADQASPTSAAILIGCAEALTRPHVLRDILTRADDLARAAAAPLRVLGALHRLARDGRAPELAALLPSCGGRADPIRAWSAAEATLLKAPDFIATYLDRAPQTNEVGRSAALLGGFLTIASETRRPLRLLEIGASAGLNLCWDLYRVKTPSFIWGPPESAVELSSQWSGPSPRLDAPVTVVERAGCDLAPLDLESAEDRRRMESYVWADQVGRLNRMRAAVTIARDTGVQVDHADAAEWITAKLAATKPGVTTVIFHSIMWQYMTPASAAAVERAISAAGARATHESPLAWLALEPPGNPPAMPEVTLTQWPGGKRHVLANAHFHGAWVKWLG